MGETTIGQLIIDLKIKTEALEKGLKTAQKKLQSIEEENKKVKNSNKELEASYLALSATAIAVLAKIGSIIKESVEEYKSYTQAMSSLQNVSEYTGQSMSEFSDIMSKFGAYMTQADLATTIKNFSLMGFEAKQTEQMIEALTNSAIRNRNANYTVSEAVRVASEGYRQGLSTLSDSAGVTENLSVMLANYAKSIGKTANQLTEAEKNQAYLNRTMLAAEPFASAMADYLDSLAGKQGQYSQAMRETQVAYAEALEPTLIGLTEMGTQLLGVLNESIEKQPELTAGITAFSVTLLSVVGGLTALATAKKVYTAVTGVATVSTKAFTAALLANPLTWVAVGLATVIGLITTVTNKINNLKNKYDELKKKLSETTDQQEKLNKIMQGTLKVTEENIQKIEKYKKGAESRLEILEKTIEAEKKLNQIGEKTNSDKQTKAINNFIKNNSRLTVSIKATKKEISVYEKYLAMVNTAKAFDTETIQKKQQEAAQIKVNAKEMNEYLRIVKNGNKATREYQEAVEKLSKQYPEASSAGGLLIDVLEGLISAEQLQAEEAWNASQTSIEGHIKNIQIALNDENIQKQVATNMGVAYDENFKPKLEAILRLLQLIGGYSPEEVPGTTSNYTPKTYSSSSSTYSNKALDNYKKQLEYKKSLDQLSLKDEIAGYEYALRKYAKTQDEKQDLTTKIYELRKELQQRELDDYTDYIDYKKSLEQISTQEEINMYQYAYDNLAKTTEQKRELEVTLYDLRKELKEKEAEDQQALLDKHLEYVQYKKSLDKLSAQEEIDAYQYAYDNLAKTTEQKRDLEVTLYDLRKQFQENALQNYIDDLEYRKSLDQVALQEEIESYEYALKNLVKTTEQKKDIEKTLYDLRKQLAEETAEALKQEAEEERKLLDKQTKQLEKYMELQKQQRGAAYDVTEQTEDLDKIIKLHKNYLAQILKDERYSLAERKEIYEDELELIKEYEDKKRELRVSSVDNTVKQLKSAITKQLEEMQNADKEAIQENIKLVEQWKETRVNAINEEYNARIEAIQKELDLLDKSEQEKTRAEEDAEYERKRIRLEQLAQYEHDATTKANYEKELAKLTEEYQKTLNDRALADKKEALKAEQELLKEEQSNKVKDVEAEANKQKEAYENQLDEIEKYYDKQIEMAEETAQKMLLNVETNQKQILDLLKKYGDAYEITGQTLGEKLAQGINNGLADKIQGIVQRLQDSIDSAINRKIASWTESIYKYEAGIDKPNTTGKSITVQQYNTIQQNPEMPSETYRKLNNVSQKLAEEFAGM